MDFFSLPRLTESAVRHGLIAKTAEDCRTQAELLAFLGEFEARKLYVPDGYSTMFAYCLGVLHFSEDTAGRRLDVARTARAFPAIFVAVAEGRLHQSAVLMLADRLTAENADELIAAATHRSKSQIALMLAERFPQPDVPTRIVALPPRPAACVVSPAPVRVTLESPATCAEPGHEAHPSPAPVRVMATVQVEVPPQRMKTTPLSPGRHKLEGTVDDGFVDLLGRAQDLQPGSAVEVLRRGLEVLVSQLEKRKFAATDKPRPDRTRPSKNPRYIPPSVKRAVRKRDGGQCTYLSAKGHRCESRRVEFDHIQEVARGGQSTVANIRLRCRAHNQYEAERTYGAEFMSAKREGVQRKAAKLRATAHARATAALAQVAAIVERERPTSAAPGPCP